MNERLRVAVVGTGAWWGREHARVFSQSPTSSCARSSVGRTRRRCDGPRSSARRPTSTSTRCSRGNRPTSCRCACPTRVTSTPRCASSKPGTRCSSRSRSCSTSPRPTGCSRRPSGATSSSRSTSTIATHDRCSWPARRSRPARSGTSRSRRGDSAARSGPAPIPTPTSSRRSATAWTCWSTSVGPIAAVSAHMTDPAGRGYTTVAVALTFDSGAVGALVGTYDSSYAYPDTHYVEVNGSAGRIQIVDTVKRFTRSVHGSELREVWEAGYFNDPDRDFHHLFERHLDDIVTALRAANSRRSTPAPAGGPSSSPRPVSDRSTSPVRCRSTVPARRTGGGSAEVEGRLVAREGEPRPGSCRRGTWLGSSDYGRWKRRAGRA